MCRQTLEIPSVWIQLARLVVLWVGGVNQIGPFEVIYGSLVVSSIMVNTKAGHLKPFMIEEKKDGLNRTVSEVTANKWQGCILANIKKEEKWISLMTQEWQPKNTANRGFTGTEAEATFTQVDLMLEYVSQYAPKALYRDITLRATSLSAVWILVRNWAGLKPLAVSSTYFTVKHSYDPSGDLTLTDFFFSIRNT